MILRIKHYYYLFRSLGPKGIWSLAKKHVYNFFRSKKARWAGASISAQELQRAIIPELVQPAAFLDHIKKRKSPLFFVDATQKDVVLAAVRQTCPTAELLMVKAADDACRHRFDLLGSGPVDLGDSIDWHVDFKTGFRWNAHQYYTGIRAARYPGDYDIKVPWELSRCQHFSWLGQAYWFTGDEKYTREFCAQMKDWIEHNPPQFGVNWACTMDVAIRAVNWLWGYAFFKDSQVLDDSFRLSFFKSLLAHGRHIRANLENSGGFTGNHYLADVTGLVYLGILLPEYKEAREWREFGLKQLETEMFKQVHPDGGDFEASTSYHRLVTEMFLSATILAKLNGHHFPAVYMQRLEKILDFIHQITRPDETIPIIGDQDNGRLHRLKAWDEPSREWSDFRPLLAVGAVLFDRIDLAQAAADQWEEACWLCGVNALALYAKSQAADDSPVSNKSSADFPDTGLYVSRKDDLYLIVDLGTNGQNGKGGHAHNDTLSFEFFAAGQTWIKDPGTYAYTFDYDARNLFRSTAYHNTVGLAGYEQNSYHPQELFELGNETTPRLLARQTASGYDYLAGEIERKKSPALIHRRSFFFDRREHVLVISDHLLGTNSPAQLYLHFAPGLVAEAVTSPHRGLKLSNAAGEMLWIFSLSPARTTVHTDTGWISGSYGRREPAPTALLECPAGHEHLLAIIPERKNTDFIERLENAIVHQNLYRELLGKTGRLKVE